MSVGRDRMENRVAVAEFRARGCVVCGERDTSCIVAHHKDPNTKLFSPGRPGKGVTPEEFRAELAKCIPMCSNCHLRFHANKIDPTTAELLGLGKPGPVIRTRRRSRSGRNGRSAA